MPTSRVPHLYIFNDHSELIVSNKVPLSPTPTLPRNGPPTTDLPVFHALTGIGGLADQVQELNMRLRLLLGQSEQDALRSSTNRHFLLHGFPGTGKSLLLRRAAEVGFPNIVTVGAPRNIGATSAKNKAS